MTNTATRDIPQPGYKILKKTFENKHSDGETHQWLIETQFAHTIKVTHPVTDGKVKPPQFVSTKHVLVTTNYKDLGENGHHANTTVYATDEDETFYDAPLYVAPGILVDPDQIEETMRFVMFAIGEA